MRRVSLKRGGSSRTILALKTREKPERLDWGNVLDKAQIEAILPHREPFLLIDRVTELVPGEYAIAEKDILATDDVFRGHFPGHPVFPGVLILEALAQTGAVAVLSQPEAQGKIILFARADEVRFRRAVSPGETLRLEMRLTKSRGPVGKGDAQAFVGSELACSGVLTFAVAER
jgi:3-hydroxyacyl-[acyl-carrier-protein] dehydratase